MTGEQAPPTQRTGLSLYANLLEDAPGTISSAPVSYNKPSETGVDQDDAAKKQQALAASLRFQPTKRPQLAAQKANAKAKAIASKLAQQVSSSSSAVAATTSRSLETPRQPADNSVQDGSISAAATQTTGPKLTAADWAATLSEDEDVNAYYASTRQKRKKRKKNKETVEIQQDWDDIYDPSRPNNYEEYKNSEEKIREVREWKDLLYRHRMSRRKSSDYDSDRSEPRPMMNKQFAPPPSMSFAPPASFDDDGEDNHGYGSRGDNGDDDDGEYVPPPPPDPATANNDASGEDAYLRRLRMSQAGAQQISTPPPPPPPPPVVAEPPAPPPGQIARAPVRYNLPPPPPEIPASEAELEAKLEAESQSRAQNLVEDDDNDDDAADQQQARSNRPGQAGFAERLMAKYGWTKGSGLGATGSGITNALYVKADKRKKKSDAEGGGFATPATMGKILGGHQRKPDQKETETDGKFGAMSEVIRLSNMLNGLDVQAELNRVDDGGSGGGLMQEIGEECSDKYGSVERVFIHHHHHHQQTDSHEGDGKEEAFVFVKFISPLSALRAVNALEGRIFNGNEIHARFWDSEKFESGVYE